MLGARNTLATSAWDFSKSKKHRERGCHLRGFHYAVTFCSGVQTVDGNLTPEPAPSTAGCNLVGMTKQAGLWPALGFGRGGPRMPGWGLVLLSSLSRLCLCSLPVPCPVFFLQDHIPVPYQPDSSSNPSSTTSSTPSSPAPPLPPSATPPSPLHPSPQCTRQQKNFNLPGTSVLGESRGLLGSCQRHLGACLCLKAMG